MAYQGMDVDAVEQASRDLKKCAEELGGSMERLSSTVQRVEIIWRGPDADEFTRRRWPMHWKQLCTVLDAIHALSQSAWSNAQDQRDVSSSLGVDDPRGAVVGEPTSDSKAPTFRDVSATAPSLVEALVKNTRYNGDRGYRIQQVFGSDGQIRLIIYIDGTSASEELSNLNNLATGVGSVTDAATPKMVAEIRDALGDEPNREVMIVGYSQGGMIAQNIADQGVFNVREVLTFGSPTVASINNYGGANVTRLFDHGDPVPTFSLFTSDVGNIVKSIPKLSNEGWGGSAPREGEIHDFSSGELLDYGSHNHTNRDAYYDVAEDFAVREDPWIVDARARFTAFDGEILQDSNIAPVDEWQPTFSVQAPSF